MVLRIRIAKREVEVRLEPLSRAGLWDKARGKIEYKLYHGGLHRIHAKLAHIPLPDGTKIHAHIDERTLLRLVLQNGRAKFDAESKVADHVPTFEAGENVTITHRGNVILEGTAQPD